MKQRIAVTGAFGYSGSYVAKNLLERGDEVLALTNSPNRKSEITAKVTTRPLAFDRPDDLAKDMAGCDSLVNTYWVRFDHDDFSHSKAEANTRTLFDAAKRAGVRRIVHVSITNPSLDSNLPYFSGKARLEKALAETGVGYSIVRPGVLFGGHDILINNIAWMIRRLPIFGVFGDGAYHIRPIHVEDFASLIVAECAQHDNRVVDAVGPESFTFRELVKMLAQAIGVRRPIVSVPAFVGYWAATIMGWFVGDVLLTREEIAGLMADLLASDAPSTGSIELSKWAAEHARQLGVRYANELARRRDRIVRYGV